MSLGQVILRFIPFVLLALGTWFMMRRLCRQVMTGTSETAWFGFTVAASWLYKYWWYAWLTGAVFLRPMAALAGYFEWPWFASLVVDNLFALLPPALLVARCECLAYPALKKIRGIDVPWKQFATNAVLNQLWLPFPVTLLWTGLRYEPWMGPPHVGTTLVISSIVVFYLLLYWLHRRNKAENYVPQALSVGELRDRAFAMAEKAGVKLNQIYVFPMAKWRLANAYASQGNDLLLTDWALRHLSVREIDAVIGHELAHMKHGHNTGHTILMPVLWLPALFWAQIKGYPGLALTALYFMGSKHLISWIGSIRSRRRERQADLGGIAICGDPQAFISALQRLDQLNATPHEFSKFDEFFFTHPSTKKRIAAISQAAGIQPVPLAPFTPAAPSLSPAAAADHTYSLPPAVEAATRGEGPLFDTKFKAEFRNRLALVFILVTSLTPALIGWLAACFTHPLAILAVWLAGLAAYAWLLIHAGDRIGRKMFSRLHDPLTRRLADTTPAMAPQSRLVALSPGPDLRLYEGLYEWDLGFLSLDSRLHYTGEQTRFTLSRDQIREIRLGLGAPQWRAPRRVYIDWADPARGTTGTFALSCNEGNSLAAEARATAALAEALTQWWRQPPTEISADAVTDQPPAFGQVTSSDPFAAIIARDLRYLLFLLIMSPGVFARGLDARKAVLVIAIPMLAIILGFLFSTFPYWRARRAARKQPPPLPPGA